MESSSISDETLLLVFTWQIVMLIFIIQNCDWKKHKEDGFGLVAFLEEKKLEMFWWIKQPNGERLKLEFLIFSDFVKYRGFIVMILARVSCGFRDLWTEGRWAVLLSGMWKESVFLL